MKEEEYKIVLKQKPAVAEAMQQYGGHFVKALGKALVHADAHNTVRIFEGFNDYWNAYLKIYEKAHAPDRPTLKLVDNR